MKETRKIVGWTVGRNGLWDITGIKLTLLGNARVMIDVFGKRGTQIQAAGISVDTAVLAEAITEMEERK